MRSTYKQLYYINRSKVKSDGTTSIMCRITIDGKAVVLSTGLYCQPEEWNSKKGEVKNNRLNGMLCEYKKRIDETYAELLKVNGVISAELLKTAMTGAVDIPKYILQGRGGGTGKSENPFHSNRFNLQLQAIKNVSLLSGGIHPFFGQGGHAFYRYYRRVWHQFHFVSENKLPS